MLLQELFCLQVSIQSLRMRVPGWESSMSAGAVYTNPVITSNVTRSWGHSPVSWPETRAPLTNTVNNNLGNMVLICSVYCLKYQRYITMTGWRDKYEVKMLILFVMLPFITLTSWPWYCVFRLTENSRHIGNKPLGNSLIKSKHVVINQSLLFLKLLRLGLMGWNNV